ncbi:HEPN domain-containing protein [Terrisporobacter muris]|uniref:HEPN domain-containing protein n=1 Tax=Terrisporobacter muris TaxID=2963284 RepID=A0A9X2MCA5_9FIRM|nr:HEPN domain-containing protein [Terrisporobacter muris]MCR1823210.1 HEPN domain-containing protein [Terrisporobacter muris]
MSNKFMEVISLERESQTKDINNTVIPSVKSEKIICTFKTTLKSIEDKFLIVDKLETMDVNDAKDDILRSQIVFVMSSLDYYMHEIVKYGIIEMFNGNKPKTKSYQNFIVSMPFVEEAIKNIESVDWLENWIVIKDKQNTYMASEKIKKCLSLISTKTIFKNIADEMSMKSNELSNRIDEIYERRNYIAHQADRNAKTGELQEIDKTFVEQSIKFIREFVENVHKEITNDI